VNIGAPWPGLDEAGRRVLAMQTKLHRWAASDPGRVFDDLHNLVYDRSFLVVAWNTVRVNKGSRSAGVDGIIPSQIADPGEWLTELQDDLKLRRFRPDRVRERMIPKRNGKLRRLGIPTVISYCCVVQRAFGFVGGHASVPSVGRAAARGSVCAS
jgi:RNA-directed DNA polymerase